ncbi:MAG: carboxylating nicotinate-nucleotide diphosphorylase [Gammaproteobacteria bacterium]
MIEPPSVKTVQHDVAEALAEDIGSGDLTASLIDAEAVATANVICREPAVLCGRPWFDEVFRQLDAAIQITWQFNDSDDLPVQATVCSLTGSARALLTGERTALNFLQTLSGTATTTRRYVDAVKPHAVKILDTRKTLPGLRLAQKYAVRCGGGHNHRIGLFDAILIKENHIAAAGSISAAVNAARQSAQQVLIEIEVENLNQIDAAMTAGADRLLLDNFSQDDLQAAVKQINGRVELEVSGGVDLNTVAAIAATGVDYISIGGLTKHLHAIDFSMRFVNSYQSVD